MLNTIVLYLARILSTLFHPAILFLPIPYIIISHTTSNVSEAIRWTFFSWIFIFSLAVYVFYEVKIGKFNNFDISNRKQRPRLFFAIGLLSLIYIATLILFQGPVSLIIITLGILFGLLGLDLINTMIKASIHVASVSGILLSIVILDGIQYWYLLLLVPLVAWSRIQLKRHTMGETITGAVFGFSLTIAMYGIIEYVLRF